MLETLMAPIVRVAGDIYVNSLRLAGAPGVTVTQRDGGALLLARQIAAACTANSLDVQVEPSVAAPLSANLPHLHCDLGWFPVHAGSRQDTIRVKSVPGFSPPSGGEEATAGHQAGDVQLTILNESGFGFRDHQDMWPSLAGKAPVIAAIGPGLKSNPLLDALSSVPRERTIVIVDADDLRGDGISISRGLSWERTATDLVWQIEHNPELRALASLPRLIIRLGLEGAIDRTRTKDRVESRLYYDPQHGEGGFGDWCPGTMPGTAEAFVAALAARILGDGESGAVDGVRRGLNAARKWVLHGFGSDPASPEYPGVEVFSPAGNDDPLIADALIPPSSSRDAADPEFWCLVDNLEGKGLEPLACRILSGDDSGLRTAPVGRFGALQTVDRSEIESFASIRTLIAEYLARAGTRRPLCLAVFGPPGSGKSFGVEQVARSVSGAGGARIEKVEVNMSQLDSPGALTGALNRVRDEVVRGRVPLVFFDEFDSTFQGPLGWLRYFLSPMQDGSFVDGEIVHPIGKAIFVFAGGLSDTFARFSRIDLDPVRDADEIARFRQAKGPDFVSRLRGFVDVKGLNPDAHGKRAGFHLIRRAMICRSLIERNWPMLVTSDPRRVNVADSVVRALIGVPAYRHGVRSLEAVLEMSSLEGLAAFGPSALPPPAQLEQHVDADAFTRLVHRGVLFSAARETLAESIHERYRAENAASRNVDSAVMRPWAELPETYRSANRAQADDMIRKLEMINCGYRPAPRAGPQSFAFTDAEIEILSETEHERWMRERMSAGYSWGARRDDALRTHPDLVPWSELPDRAKQLDRNAVLAIPECMAAAGFEVYRL